MAYKILIPLVSVLNVSCCISRNCPVAASAEYIPPFSLEVLTSFRSLPTSLASGSYSLFSTSISYQNYVASHSMSIVPATALTFLIHFALFFLSFLSGHTIYFIYLSVILLESKLRASGVWHSLCSDHCPRCSVYSINICWM